MARLSAENYNKLDPETPPAPRKPSRFRNMFRGSHSRSSLSPDPQDADIVKTFPQDTEIVKPGFEKVGLLPSERADKLKKLKKEHERNTTGESLEKQVEELENITIPHVGDMGLEDSGSKLWDGADTTLTSNDGTVVENIAENDKKQAENDSIKAASNIATECEAANWDKGLPKGSATQEMAKISTFELVDNLEDEGYLRNGQTMETVLQNGMEKEVKLSPCANESFAPVPNVKHLEGLNPSQVVVDNVPDVDSLEGRCGPAQPTWVIADSSHQASSAIEQSDVDMANQSSKPQCINVEAVEVTAPNSGTTSIATSPLLNTIDVVYQKGSNQLKISEDSAALSSNLISEPPLNRTHANPYQRTITILYIGFLLRLALGGPNMFLVSVWKLGVVLSIYAFMRHQLGFKGQDLVLVPPENALKAVGNVIRETYDVALEDLATRIAEKMRESQC